MASANTPEGNKKGLLARLMEIGGTPVDYPPWRLIYHFQLYLRCQKEACNEPICNEIRALIYHRRACVRGRSCDFPNCWMYMPVCMHFTYCKSPGCAECLDIITKVTEHDAMVLGAENNQNEK